MSNDPADHSTLSLFPELSPTDSRGRCALASGSPPGRDRKAYIDECAMRWNGECLRDARRNWQLFEEHHDELVAILAPYLRDSGVQDIAGKYHNPDHTLTSWLWTCSNAEGNAWIWDFCEHYQKCHLRRGLIAYAKQVIRELQANDKISQPGGPMPANQETEANKDGASSGLAVGAGFDIFFRIAEAYHGYIPGAKLAMGDRETLALAQDLRENKPLRGLLDIIDAAHRATEQECTCGGNPADDPQCCPACKVYHRLEAAKVASMSNI